MKQIRTYKFRLYPNTNQWISLNNTLDACRWIYNKFVEQTKNEFLSRNDMNYLLTEIKQQESWLYNYHAKMLQMVSTQLEAAQKSLIERKKKGHKIGQLQFVGHDQYRSFTYNQRGFKLESGTLYLSKIGRIKIVQHRLIPDNVEIKQVTITKMNSGKWFACLTCDINYLAIPIQQINLKNSVGIDLGIKNFAYDSQGFQTSNPLNLKRMLKPLKRIQRKISRRQKGSKNRKKAILWYRRIHERITNRRKDFLHKLSTHYAKSYDVTFVERLAKLNMMKNHKFARSIADSSWGMFVNMLDYKCKMVIGVSPSNTTIDCSRCNNPVPKSLAIRIHRCNHCGLILDRDYNASINILKKGLKIFGIFTFNLPQELRKVTPVEIAHGSLKQENAILLLLNSRSQL